MNKLIDIKSVLKLEKMVDRLVRQTNKQTTK